MGIPVTVFQTGEVSPSFIYHVLYDPNARRRHSNKKGKWGIVLTRKRMKGTGPGNPTQTEPLRADPTTIEKKTKKKDAVDRAKELAENNREDVFGVAVWTRDNDFDRFIASQRYWRGAAGTYRPYGYFDD